jgi:hypothetical protein
LGVTGLPVMERSVLGETSERFSSLGVKGPPVMEGSVPHCVPGR